MSLVQLADDLWTLDADLRLLGADFGARMSVVRLPDGLLLLSPVRLGAATRGAIAGLGEVRWIVAPNLFHHLYAARAREAFPGAELWAPPGLEAKTGLAADRCFERDELPSAWEGVLDVHRIAGMPRLDERVLVHRPSRSLLATDLLFNIRRGSLWSRTFFRLAGIWNGPAQSRLFRAVIKDCDAYAASLEPLLATDLERIVMAHGSVIETDGSKTLRDATAWAFD